MHEKKVPQKRLIIVIAVLVVFCCGIAIILLLPAQEDGSTLASREVILQDLPKGIDWQIASEISVDGYLISSIYSATKDGLAVFEPQKNGGYKEQSVYYANKGAIVCAKALISQVWYDIFWLNQANLAYAEIVYTIDGQQMEPSRLEFKDLPIVYHQAPGDDYTLHICYYDAYGNSYE